MDDPTKGIELFNSGRYWDAHEAWEHEWMPDRKGPESGFYKGLIQVAAGCLHYQRRNRRGAVNKWRSGAGYLRHYAPIHKGVRLEPLIREVNGFLAEMGSRAWPELTMPRIIQIGSAGNTAQNYLTDLGKLVRDLALEAKAQKDEAQSEYAIGRLMALHEVVSLMQQQADAFGMDLGELGLADIDPERDLL